MKVVAAVSAASLVCVATLGACGTASQTAASIKSAVESKVTILAIGQVAAGTWGCDPLDYLDIDSTTIVDWGLFEASKAVPIARSWALNEFIVRVKIDPGGTWTREMQYHPNETLETRSGTWALNDAGGLSIDATSASFGSKEKDWTESLVVTGVPSEAVSGPVDVVLNPIDGSELTGPMTVDVRGDVAQIASPVLNGSSQGVWVCFHKE